MHVVFGQTVGQHMFNQCEVCSNIVPRAVVAVHRPSGPHFEHFRYVTKTIPFVLVRSWILPRHYACRRPRLLTVDLSFDCVYS